jgi:hypothetical protein
MTEHESIPTVPLHRQRYHRSRKLSQIVPLPRSTARGAAESKPGKLVIIDFARARVVQCKFYENTTTSIRQVRGIYRGNAMNFVQY